MDEWMSQFNKAAAEVIRLTREMDAGTIKMYLRDKQDKIVGVVACCLDSPEAEKLGEFLEGLDKDEEISPEESQ